MKKIEIEKKYVIEKPTPVAFKSAAEYNVSKIEQIYLEAPNGETLRIRKREYSTHTEYVRTHKKRIDKISAVETEDEISAEEYSAYKQKILHGTRPIIKKRHTFKYMGQLFEIDEYPEWKRSCIVETELGSRDVQVAFPDFIRIIKEVSGDFSYSNAAMSRHFPKELV
ncbi:MAG: hypothetical protein J6Q85_08185 [Clostridia bacterium]|nr:hypothetical protein [Clostridia bacterium]